MADTFNKEDRSYVMRKVRSKNNKSTELRLISLFKQYEVKGWKRNYPVKGHPDFVFIEKRIALFVDGCFWHGHDCRNTRPKDNADYWMRKRQRNMQHDKEVTALFSARGWTVFRIWECELKKAHTDETMAALKRLLSTK